MAIQFGSPKIVKELSFSTDAKQKLIDGINKLAKAVGSTLGASGRTVVLEDDFGNPDMVGHTGDINAAVKACETVDQCVSQIVPLALVHGYSTLIIADHGNSETMINPDGSPNTAHTTNPVPLILVDKTIKYIRSGVLGDIAPTILKLMNLDIPKAMTQTPLID